MLLAQGGMVDFRLSKNLSNVAEWFSWRKDHPVLDNLTSTCLQTSKLGLATLYRD
jgi:hypothetical protein